MWAGLKAGLPRVRPFQRGGCFHVRARVRVPGCVECARSSSGAWAGPCFRTVWRERAHCSVPHSCGCARAAAGLRTYWRRCRQQDEIRQRQPCRRGRTGRQNEEHAGRETGRCQQVCVWGCGRAGELCTDFDTAVRDVGAHGGVVDDVSRRLQTRGIVGTHVPCGDCVFGVSSGGDVCGRVVEDVGGRERKGFVWLKYAKRRLGMSLEWRNLVGGVYGGGGGVVSDRRGSGCSCSSGGRLLSNGSCSCGSCSSELATTSRRYVMAFLGAFADVHCKMTKMGGGVGGAECDRGGGGGWAMGWGMGDGGCW